MLLFPPQMLSMMGELERIHGEQNSELNHMKKDTNRELALVGERNSAIMSDVKATLSAYKLSIENDRDRFEERVMSLLDRATGNWTSLLVGLLCLHNAWVFSASNITLIPFLCITRQKYWNPCDKLDKCGAFYSSRYFKLFEEVSFMSSGGIQIDGEPGPLIFCSCTSWFVLCGLRLWSINWIL